ncbi:hypothetical protein P8X24_04875 [Pyrococcus kukulkanii]|uniref:hypothetical protein n=1 Tax=Pyrococcus kukulkanii TaxID=1609559 RepID=UPI00356307C8
MDVKEYLRQRYGINARLLDYMSLIPSHRKERILNSALDLRLKLETKAKEYEFLDIVQPVAIYKYYIKNEILTRNIINKNISKIVLQNRFSEEAIIVMSKRNKNQEVEFIEPSWYQSIKQIILFFAPVLLYLLREQYKRWSVYRITFNHKNKKNRAINILLVVSANINYLKATWPIVDKLTKMGHVSDIYLLGDKQIITQLVPYRVETIFEPKFKIKSLIKAWKTYNLVLHTQKIPQKSLHWIAPLRKLPLWTLSQTLLDLTIGRGVSEKVYYHTSPKIVIVGDDRAAHIRMFVRMAKKLKIPVIEVQHGIYRKDVPTGIPISDKILVWGEIFRQVLSYWGATRDQIEIIGNPIYDKKFPKNNISYHKQNSFSFTITFATQPGYLEINKAIIQRICNAISDFKLPVKFIIKPHPRENISVYNKILSKYNKILSNNSLIRLETTRKELHEVLKCTDILITITSTAGIEALLYEIPIISLAPIVGEDNPFGEYAISINNLEELKKKIKDMVLNYKKYKKKIINHHKKFIRDYFYKLDGQASERGAKIVLSLVSSIRRDI